MLLIWGVPSWAVALFYAGFTAVEMSFFSATLLKVPSGGWCAPPAADCWRALSTLRWRRVGVQARSWQVPCADLCLRRFPIVIAVTFSSLMYCWHWVCPIPGLVLCAEVSVRLCAFGAAPSLPAAIPGRAGCCQRWAGCAACAAEPEPGLQQCGRWGPAILMQRSSRAAAPQVGRLKRRRAVGLHVSLESFFAPGPGFNATRGLATHSQGSGTAWSARVARLHSKEQPQLSSTRAWQALTHGICCCCCCLAWMMQTCPAL